jgi:transketolase
MNNDKIIQLAVNTIRTLSIDAVQAAKSGHPGTPMALAPLVYTIWNRAMNFDPQYPIWPNRDRFVLSNGHASMLLWSILHLTKVQAVNADYETLGKPSVSLEDIRRFRQLDSKAPGHPEYHWVSGVETTTGPLGQGVATSVGMAIAQKWLANRYNKPGFDIFNYNIYAVCGDGWESVKFRGQSGHAAFASVLPRKAGYQRRKVSSRSPLRTLVRVCSKRCAPRGVHRICCFFTNRLLMT